MTDFSRILNSSMGMVPRLPTSNQPQPQITNLKEKADGSIYVDNTVPTSQKIDLTNVIDSALKISHSEHNSTKENPDGSKGDPYEGDAYTEITELTSINFTDINIVFNKFFVNLQNKKADNILANRIHSFSNNVRETANLAIKMGGNSSTWNKILNIANGLSTFSSNLKLFNTFDAFSFEICSSQWGMAISTLSILSSILNDEEDVVISDTFSQIYTTLTEIQMAINEGFKKLESILIDRVCEKLTSIHDQLIRMETIMCNSFKDIHRKDLLDICDAVKKDLSGEFIQTHSERRNIILKLSTWIDYHCSSSIETDIHRIDTSKSAHIVIGLLNKSDPSFVLNVMMTLLNKQNSFINLEMFISIYQLFVLANKKWKINYDTKKLCERIKVVIKQAQQTLESIDQNDIDILERQIKHYKFLIGRAIAKSGKITNRDSFINQINKLSNSIEIMRLVDYIELRRLIILKICELTNLKVPVIQSKDEFLTSIPDIEETPNRAHYNGGGLPYAPTRSSPMGGHKVAESGTSEELLYYLEHGLDVNSHCGWGNVLLNYLFGRPTPTGLHHLLKCPELDKTSGQKCLNSGNSTWPIGSRPIQYILNNAYMALAILFVADGYNIDLTNYGAHWQGGHWGDCGNLYDGALSQKYINCIITLEVIKLMEDKTSFWHKDKLRDAYKYYKEYESGFYNDNEYKGDLRSLFVFSCLLGLVPPIIKRMKIDPSEKISPNLTWSDLSFQEKGDNTVICRLNWKELRTSSISVMPEKSKYREYLNGYIENLDIEIRSSNTDNDIWKRWINLLENFCTSVDKLEIKESFHMMKEFYKNGNITFMKRELNYLNAILKKESNYPFGTNIDILLSSDE